MSQSTFTLPESAPVSQRVTHAVAEEVDTDPFDLDPLFNVIDPESLNALFEPTNTGSHRTTGSVAFEYAGCEVTVSADGTVDVTARGARTESQGNPTSVD
ncbi:HalOD1 output domain-containing protein [Natrarchaeobius chitinivorans]|uniref:Halobacterial output domain-containing protein n=1 Tax=Natrarchaeobius chitinivorans TaxID=1679083 RepID=A0A3N6N1C6_NATCH|nr:HalOD1 output domain-containing protein [Natrarchaeobius chitinivorans]RQG91782.1 hypothetical protein EA473_18440 [Natrarchaeobius chitinivorans]